MTGFSKVSKEQQKRCSCLGVTVPAGLHARHVCCALSKRASASIRAQVGEYAQFELLSRGVQSTGIL